MRNSPGPTDYAAVLHSSHNYLAFARQMIDAARAGDSLSQSTTDVMTSRMQARLNLAPRPLDNQISRRGTARCSSHCGSHVDVATTSADGSRRERCFRRKCHATGHASGGTRSAVNGGEE